MKPSVTRYAKNDRSEIILFKSPLVIYTRSASKILYICIFITRIVRNHIVLSLFIGILYLSSISFVDILNRNVYFMDIL